MSTPLLSTQNYVESPFIIVRIGNYTFGNCRKQKISELQATHRIDFPNYMESLSIVKVNGAINTYTLNMMYPITSTDDPNMLEKVFGSISDSRMISLQYGDWCAPSYIYKEETAIITKLTTRVDMKNSRINYTINCTSTALPLTATVCSFSAKKGKPSEEIKKLLNNKRYGLLDIFPGMRNHALSNFIAGDDQEVELSAKPNTSVIDYISYLVSCMRYQGDSDAVKTACYLWSTYDDISNKYGGTYFKVVKVLANANTSMSYNTYELDIGYPTNASVIDFNINNDESWSLLYDYSKSINIPQYVYSIDDEGRVVEQNAPSLLASKKQFTPTEDLSTWWSLVTQFPINATVTLKGLMRPTMLMSYVKINTYFYGHKHISSGLYSVVKQQDQIDSNGYRTTLTLLRLGGDESYT